MLVESRVRVNRQVSSHQYDSRCRPRFNPEPGTAVRGLVGPLLVVVVVVTEVVADAVVV